MASPEHLDLLQQNIDTWNTWRKEHQDIQPDFSEADLSYANLRSANLRYADLSWASIYGTDLDGADLRDSESH